jgi:hypothetical protein
VSEPPREQNHESDATTADRGDERPVAAIATKLPRCDRANVRVTDVAIPLAGIASNEEHDRLGT